MTAQAMPDPRRRWLPFHLQPAAQCWRLSDRQMQASRPRRNVVRTECARLPCALPARPTRLRVGAQQVAEVDDEPILPAEHGRQSFAATDCAASCSTASAAGVVRPTRSSRGRVGRAIAASPRNRYPGNRARSDPKNPRENSQRTDLRIIVAPKLEGSGKRLWQNIVLCTRICMIVSMTVR
jgi:hypothetical protein